MIFNYLKLCVSHAEPHRLMCLVDQLAKFSLLIQSVILTHVKLCSFSVLLIPMNFKSLRIFMSSPSSVR